MQIKTVKPIEELLEDKLFIISSSASNSIYDGKPSIELGINGKKIIFSVGEVTKIPYEYYCLLKDNAIQVNPFEEEFNPFNL